MKLLNALRGGSNKDAMRQTTSLTMAYLLEQNARFETFMRQKVEELEAVVAQQQARHAEADETRLEAPAPEETNAAEPGQTPAGLAETRPVKPVTSYFGDFNLDDPEAGPEEELFAADDEPSIDLPGQPAGPAEEAATADRLPDLDEPPDWQALLLGSRPSTETTASIEPAEPTPDPAGVSASEETAGGEWEVPLDKQGPAGDWE